MKLLAKVTRGLSLGPEAAAEEVDESALGAKEEETC